MDSVKKLMKKIILIVQGYLQLPKKKEQRLKLYKFKNLETKRVIYLKKKKSFLYNQDKYKSCLLCMRVGELC